MFIIQMNVQQSGGAVPKIRPSSNIQGSGGGVTNVRASSNVSVIVIVSVMCNYYFLGVCSSARS